MSSKDRKIVEHLTDLAKTIQRLLSLEVADAHDFSVAHAALQSLLENYEHLDFTIDFYNSATTAIKHVTQLRQAHPHKKHLFPHLDNVVELLKSTIYKHPILKKSKFTKLNAKSTEQILKQHIIHAKEIIKAAEKAYAETNRILHALQQQYEPENVSLELTERINKTATKMHLMNMAATIATDKITVINNELQGKF